MKFNLKFKNSYNSHIAFCIQVFLVHSYDKLVIIEKLIKFTLQ